MSRFIMLHLTSGYPIRIRADRIVSLFQYVGSTLVELDGGYDRDVRETADQIEAMVDAVMDAHPTLGAKPVLKKVA
jgi:hypothetical protein